MLQAIPMLVSVLVSGQQARTGNPGPVVLEQQQTHEMHLPSFPGQATPGAVPAQVGTSILRPHTVKGPDLLPRCYASFLGGTPLSACAACSTSACGTSCACMADPPANDRQHTQAANIAHGAPAAQQARAGTQPQAAAGASGQQMRVPTFVVNAGQPDEVGVHPSCRRLACILACRG